MSSLPPVEIAGADQREGEGSPARPLRGNNGWLLGIAALYLVAQVATSGLWGYGYFIDELYYLACSRRLDFGYVDHPPLAPLLLWLVRRVLGESLLAIRLLPALAGAATIFLAGLMARRLGGDAFAQLMAALAVAVAPACLVLFSFYTVNAFEILLWSLGLWLVLRLLGGDQPRLWLPLGVVFGLGLENKHTIVLLGGALAVGLILTPARRHFSGPWLWAGAAAALAIFLPNLVWQARHGWISLEFYRSATLYKNVPTSPLKAVLDQVLYMHPATLPLWACGLFFCLSARQGRPYRPLGWMFLALLLAQTVSGTSRPDRIAGAYPVLWAAGAVVIEQAVRRFGRAWARPAILATLVGSGGILAPLALPVLPPAQVARYVAALGLTPQIERGKPGRVPQWLADRLGWEELVESVAEVFHGLPPEEQAEAVVAGEGYGVAGAIELFGPGRGLPRVISTHNNYFLWGPGEDTPEVLIGAGVPAAALEQFFAEVRQAGSFSCDYCYQDGMRIVVARGPKVSVHDVWPSLKHFE